MGLILLWMSAGFRVRLARCRMFRAYVGLASRERLSSSQKREGRKGRGFWRRVGARKAGGYVNERLVPEGCAGRRPNAKGLRHFSAKVCEKVRSKRRTTYNEVADELVAELRHGVADEKNIRRRVYDALNVLMAVGVFTKVKKDIFWRGFPETPKRKVDVLAGEKDRLLELVRKKQKYLQVHSHSYFYSTPGISPIAVELERFLPVLEGVIGCMHEWSVLSGLSSEVFVGGNPSDLIW